MSKTQLLMTDKLMPNDYNPNRMTEDEFTELVAEVRHLGRLPKPVVVRPGNNGEFTIIDGEHGWKAAQEVGLKKIACEIMDADDFEAMRQTYKRNQHGTHNKVLLAKMFKRMGKEKGLSLRDLAKEIEVSEGTIRNTIEYLRAVKVRNDYAGERDSESEIADLSIKQVRIFNRLPMTVANIWLDGGANIKAILNKHKSLSGLVRDLSYAKEEKLTEKECLDYVYGGYEKSGLLKYLKPVNTPEQFITALNRVREWHQWENKYFWHNLDAKFYSVEEFRNYARYYYEGIWPFENDVRWMEGVLKIIIKKDGDNARFRITPDEFETILNQIKECIENSEKRSISFDTFKSYFKLAIYEKTGEKVESESLNIREQFMQVEIEKEAPDYIRESEIYSILSKYALWKVKEEMQQETPENAEIIEEIAKLLAKENHIYRNQNCTMNKSDRKFHERFGDDVDLIEENWAVRGAISEYLARYKVERQKNNNYDSANNIELAMEVSDFVYDREKNKEEHKEISVKLSQLKIDELRRLHEQITYCNKIREIREELTTGY